MRLNLKISENALTKINDSIFITGSARSGTTILGKLVHSFKNVEYAFEPPMLFTMFSMIDILTKEEWMLLYESYLYEEFFMNAVAGRGINCNRSDDSSIYNVKSQKEVEEKLQNSIKKIELEKIACQKILAYKVPDVIPFIPKLQTYYSGFKVLVMKRDVIGTMNSLLAKKWFADDGEKGNVIWPYRMCLGHKIPFWVPECDSDKWVKLSEIDRCAYYYIQVNENVSKIQNRKDISYTALLADPMEVSRSISKWLNLQFGEKTIEIVKRIQATNKERDLGIINKVSIEFQDALLSYSNL